jgi:uncharacterized protein YbaA (DUF1428 family)
MYVNGYILAVPEEKKEAYVEAALIVAEVAKDFGALEVYENWELEVPDGEHTDYRQAVKALPGEKIVFSWVVWPDRETGATAHRGMWEDPRMEEIAEMPVDSKRMILGGFEPVVAHHHA